MHADEPPQLDMPAQPLPQLYLQLPQPVAAAQERAGGLPAVGAHQAQVLQIASQQVCKYGTTEQTQRWKSAGRASWAGAPRLQAGRSIARQALQLASQQDAGAGDSCPATYLPQPCADTQPGCRPPIALR